VNWTRFNARCPELAPEDIQQALAFAAANLEDSAAETDAA
jgi:uncharacterized protein (DUF433 family)